MNMPKPSAAQKKAVVRSLALVAWADRVLKPEEKRQLSRAATELTGLSPKQVQAMLDDGKTFLRDGGDPKDALAELAGLSPETGLALLRSCYDVSASDRAIPESELGMIETIARAIFPAGKVVHVLRWLRTRKDMLALEDELVVAKAAKNAAKNAAKSAAKSAAAKTSRATKSKLAAKRVRRGNTTRKAGGSRPRPRVR